MLLLADDHPLTLEGIRAFLEPHCTSVGTVTDGRALLLEAARLKPDLIVLDITMPLLNGIDSAIQIKKACWGETGFCSSPMHSDPLIWEAALSAEGDAGMCWKSSVREELLDAVKQRVMDGHIYYSPGGLSGNLERLQRSQTRGCGSPVRVR